VQKPKQKLRQMEQPIMQCLKFQTKSAIELFLRLRPGRQAALIHIFSYFKFTIFIQRKVVLSDRLRKHLWDQIVF